MTPPAVSPDTHGPGVPPEYAAQEAQERRSEAIRAEAVDVVESALDRGSWARVDALVGIAWLWERQEEGIRTDREQLEDAVADALWQMAGDD